MIHRNEHQELIAQLRRIIKQAAPGVSVRMRTGTAWGNVHIRGSGEFGEMTAAESAALERLGLTRVYRSVIMYGEVGYVLKLLSGTVTERDIEEQRRYQEYRAWD